MGRTSEFPYALSIPFPTAVTMQCEVGNSHPPNILWKYLIAARYPRTVRLWFLKVKQIAPVDAFNALKQVSSFTAAPTPFPHTSQGPFPSNALRRHQVVHRLQYVFCVLPLTEASARFSTSLCASFSSSPSPTYVPARRGLRRVHDSVFRVIAPHTMFSMYSVESRVVELSRRTRSHFYLYFVLSIPLVRASADCARSFLSVIWKFRPPQHSALREYA